MARRGVALPLAATRALLAAALLASCAAQSSCPVVPLAYPEGATLLPQLLDAGAGAIVDLRWLGADTGFVLALTSSGRLWRSVNGGLTWSDDTPKLAGALDNHGVAGIVVSERHATSRVLLVGYFSRSLDTTLMWSTTTSGYSYEQPCALVGGADHCVSAPASEDVVTVKPHPTAPDVLALLSQRRLCSGTSSSCFRRDVLVSTDFGHTWQSSLRRAASGQSVVGFIDVDWAPEARTQPAGALPSAALLATAYLTAEDQMQGVYWAGYWDKRGAQPYCSAAPRRVLTRTPAAQCTCSSAAITSRRTRCFAAAATPSKSCPTAGCAPAASRRPHVGWALRLPFVVCLRADLPGRGWQLRRAQQRGGRLVRDA